MSSATILTGKSDDNIYRDLVSLDPSEKLILGLIENKKLELVKRLLNDPNIDEERKKLWNASIKDFMKYVNDNLN
ncbi:MAG TPA: hypothetical protein PLH91_05045 [Tenuifilaceae bacterium]|nr:hypothetical protein [Tenuifilaceae bacterium]HOZ14257.1 hypothetical protein [Tenuifilaceae bacterium]HPI44576.1 hypothetical protein [Tenuifilaceae bacterium]HPN21200.1 hypothetical protein [Tenuifilaceae bacterium]